MVSVDTHVAEAEELLTSFDSSAVETIITDIPYGEVNRDDNGMRSLDKGNADVVTFDVPNIIREMKRVTSDNLYVFCGHEQISVVRSVINEDMSYRTLVWEKTNPTPLNCQYLYLSDVELCAYGKHSGGTFNNNYESCVFEHKAGKRDKHPTQKPVELLEQFVTDATNEGDTILDPFAGSGSTAVAAVKNDRNAIIGDMNPEYIEVAEERLSDVLKENEH
jgi:site-specific DNA-methyltransferase (adenine-specific)